jgi:hypothetical protein
MPEVTAVNYHSYKGSLPVEREDKIFSNYISQTYNSQMLAVSYYIQILVYHKGEIKGTPSDKIPIRVQHLLDQGAERAQSSLLP